MVGVVVMGGCIAVEFVGTCIALWLPSGGAETFAFAASYGYPSGRAETNPGEFVDGRGTGRVRNGGLDAMNPRTLPFPEEAIPDLSIGLEICTYINHLFYHTFLVKI